MGLGELEATKYFPSYPYRLFKRDGVSVAFWEGAFDTMAHLETNLLV